jgi:cytochrome c553
MRRSIKRTVLVRPDGLSLAFGDWSALMSPATNRATRHGACMGAPLIGRPGSRGAAVLCAVLLLWGAGPVQGQADKGRQAFARAGCESCHGSEAKDADARGIRGGLTPQRLIKRRRRHGT